MSPQAITRAQRINAHPSELCMLPADYRPDLLPAVADTVVELKMDGIPLIWTAANGTTREGVTFDATRHLWQGLDRIDAALGGRHMLHGEYVHKDGFEATLGDFRRGGGTGCLFLFDAVPLDAYHGLAPSLSLRERRARLNQALAEVSRDRRPGVGVMRQAIGFDAEGVELAAGEAWADGFEGLVIKDLASPYVRERSTSWLRLKRTETVDVRVVRLLLREGSDILSALVCDDGGREARVGVGFSEAQRRPGVFRPGDVVEIKALGRTSKGALRSPSFVRARGDKA